VREAWTAIGLPTEIAGAVRMLKAAASITHERGRAARGDRTILKPAGMARTLRHVTRVEAEAPRLRPATAHGRGRETWTAIGLRAEIARAVGMIKPAAFNTHERDRAAQDGRTILKPAGVARTLGQVTRVGAEALRPRPATAHWRGREPWTAIGLRAEFAQPAGMIKPAAFNTHERDRAAQGGRTILKPAGVARTLVQVTRVGAEAPRLRPATARGRGREPWTAIGVRAEFARPLGMTKPVAFNTHERGRAARGGGTILKPAGVARTVVQVTGVSGSHRRTAAVGGEATRGVLLFREVFVPAVHHALTGLLQVGFSLALFRRAILGLKVSSAEQEARSRA